MVSEMRFQIQHETRYSFGRPVKLSQHCLRFRPRGAGAQFLHDYELTISPTPAGVTEHVDAEGNAVARAWWRGPTPFLHLSKRADVSSTRTNPYDFLVDSANRELTLSYPPNIARLLQPALQRASPSNKLVVGDPIADLGRELAQESGNHLLKFLSLLARRIQQDWTAIRREFGEPWSAQKTFQEKQGACRDLTCLYMDVCRTMGIGARFVSGYQQGAVDQDRRDLHAWAEVYVPGAGWRGFDPTSGLAVADCHVTVAASVHPDGASCVHGSLVPADESREPVQSTLEATIQIHCEETESPSGCE